MRFTNLKHYLLVFLCLILISPLAGLSKDKKKAKPQEDLMAKLSLIAMKLRAIGPAVTSGRRQTHRFGGFGQW